MEYVIQPSDVLYFVVEKCFDRCVERSVMLIVMHHNNNAHKFYADNYSVLNGNN